MKQIITVLAILISGIASAQLYQTSICGGNNDPRHIDYNGQDYLILDDLQDQIAGFDFVCLTRGNGSINREWRSYFINYLGAIRIEDHSNQNFYRIVFSNGTWIERRTSGRYNVRVSSRGSIGHYNLSETMNARDAWNYARTH